MMIMVVSCSSPGPPAPTETVRELSRSRIALPESVAASSLASASAELLVGGRASASGDHPVLFAVDASGSTRSVRTQSRYLSTGFRQVGQGAERQRVSGNTQADDDAGSNRRHVREMPERLTAMDVRDVQLDHPSSRPGDGVM
jgi:hypothetical protein